MPVPERYYREQIQRAEKAEQRARRDSRRAWARAIGEVWLWTFLGLIGLGLALHSNDVDRAWVYWWGGAFVWVGGVSYALFTAFKRAIRRGDWR